MSVTCAVCHRPVRLTHIGTLARHRDEHGHHCDNTGCSQEANDRYAQATR